MGVFWLTGLSGSGKTTISNLIFTELKKGHKNVIRIDGDVIREVFGNDLGYSKEERLKSSYRNARLCKYLDDEGMTVICSTISMFEEVRIWNRKNIKKYFEVYLKVPIDELKSRDIKGVYSEPKGKVVDFENGWQEPESPNLIIQNSKISDVNKNAKKILKAYPFLI